MLVPPRIRSSEAAAAGLNAESTRTECTLLLSDNTTFNGGLQQLQFHGHGELKWKDGCRYVGEFANGRMRGRGSFYWSGDLTGQVFEGEWEENRMHGQVYYCLSYYTGVLFYFGHIYLTGPATAA